MELARRLWYPGNVTPSRRKPQGKIPLGRLLKAQRAPSPGTLPSGAPGAEALLVPRQSPHEPQDMEPLQNARHLSTGELPAWSEALSLAFGSKMLP